MIGNLMQIGTGTWMQYLTYMCLSKLPVRSNMSQANAIQIGEGGISKFIKTAKPKTPALNSRLARVRAKHSGV